MQNAIGAVALAAILLTGCSSAGTQPVSASSPAPSPAATTSQTPSTPAASKADYAKVALKVQTGVDEYVSDWKKNTCSSGSVAQGDPLCFTIAMRAESVANIVGISLKGAQQPKSPSYLGTPPDDLTKILGTTVTASDEAVSAAKEWRAANCPTEYACQNKTRDVGYGDD
ncbi:outer membrane murein-binding lipoprotein Lpp [Arthrobacter pascens]|uniref:hypothetical protein n=1 Tax=Arthrobacter pascens TaxID=1677 RepID=UPI0027936A61|nr:hypothetical protein [Arthrobacter pascens]MDQ0679109.1 outer membrane murein-binding lipoprotein Lpp [Arthrobacter pascens]